MLSLAAGLRRACWRRAPAAFLPTAAPVGAPAGAPAASYSSAAPVAADRPKLSAQPVRLSDDFARVVGHSPAYHPVPRGDAIKLCWAYIKEHRLQSAEDGRQIECDANFQQLFGTDKMSMFEMLKLLYARNHISNP